MDRRTRLSLRLKAARWLAGGLDADGALIALPVKNVAELPYIKGNISLNRLTELEQRKTDVRDMELEKIADAFGLPHAWFLSEDLTGVFSSGYAGDLGPAGALRLELLGDEPSPEVRPETGGRRGRRGDGQA